MQLKAKLLTFIIVLLILTSVGAVTFLILKKGLGFRQPFLTSPQPPAQSIISTKLPAYFDKQVIEQILNPPAVRTYNPPIVYLEGKLIEATPMYVNKTNAYFGHYWMLETGEQLIYLMGEADNLFKKQQVGQQMRIFGSWVSDTLVAGRRFPALRVKFIEQ